MGEKRWNMGEKIYTNDACIFVMTLSVYANEQFFQTLNIDLSWLGNGMKSKATKPPHYASHTKNKKTWQPKFIR